MLSTPGDTSRRTFLINGTALVVTVTLAPSLADASPDAVAAAIKQKFGDKELKSGRIKLDLPTIAENGLVVPLNFEVESPMTENDYVKSVYFYADGNPNPNIADYRFTPLSPKAAANIRIRLAQTQNIVAIAEMSNGDVYSIKREVKVTIGGCGG
jgi:sulfur-oxidizing protein SoxY